MHVTFQPNTTLLKTQQKDSLVLVGARGEPGNEANKKPTKDIHDNQHQSTFPYWTVE